MDNKRKYEHKRNQRNDILRIRGLEIQVPFSERLLEAAGRAHGLTGHLLEPTGHAHGLTGHLWEPVGRALSINGLAEGFYTHEFAIYWVFAAPQSCFIESDSLICLFLRWF